MGAKAAWSVMADDSQQAAQSSTALVSVKFEQRLIAMESVERSRVARMVLRHQSEPQLRSQGTRLEQCGSYVCYALRAGEIFGIFYRTGQQTVWAACGDDRDDKEFDRAVAHIRSHGLGDKVDLDMRQFLSAKRAEREVAPLPAPTAAHKPVASSTPLTPLARLLDSLDALSVDLEVALGASVELKDVGPQDGKLLADFNLARAENARSKEHAASLQKRIDQLQAEMASRPADTVSASVAASVARDKARACRVMGGASNQLCAEMLGLVGDEIFKLPKQEGK